MGEQNFININRKSLIMCVLIGVAQWLISLHIVGFDKGLICGIACGAIAMALNFNLLRIMVARFISKGRIGASVLFYVVRLAIYVIGAVLSYMLGLSGLIGFASGVLSMIISVVIAWKTDKHADKRSGAQ